jgi:hypothetical protein
VTSGGPEVVLATSSPTAGVQRAMDLSTTYRAGERERRREAASKNATHRLQSNKPPFSRSVALPVSDRSFTELGSSLRETHRPLFPDRALSS